MAGHTPGLIKTFVASGAVPRKRIVKFGASDTQVSQSSASTDYSIGISSELDAADGERMDVILSGIADVTYGGTVTRGRKLTSDAQGRAVQAAPGAGVNAEIIGVAMVSGVVGDTGSALIIPNTMQG